MPTPPPENASQSDPVAPVGSDTSGNVGTKLRRRRTRRLVAVATVGGLLTGVVGVSVATSLTQASASETTTNGANTTQDLSYGRGSQSPFGNSGSTSGSGSNGIGGDNPWGGSGGSGNGSGSGSGLGSSSGTGWGSSSSVNASTATSAQSQGVVLIDTVLSHGGAAGTGIVLTSSGEILTNYHVVEQSSSIKVTVVSSGKTYTATVVGDDPTKDVALLQLKQARGLRTASIDYDAVAVGTMVTAVGNAGGTSTLTAAKGTVTGLSKSISTQAEASAKSENLTGLIETNANIVAGDSGGPLLDSQGDVTGIDTAASSGGRIDGYAIPITKALAIVAQIQKGHETSTVRIGSKAFLGIELSTSSQSAGQAYQGQRQQSSASGATVAGVVSGDAAAQAGLTAGDVITKVGPTTIATADGLTVALAKKEPGDEVKITWTTTGGQTKTATITLGASPIN